MENVVLNEEGHS